MKKPVFGETNLDFRQGAENIPNRNALKMVVSLEGLWCSCGNSLNTLPFFPWCSTLDATKTRKKMESFHGLKVIVIVHLQNLTWRWCWRFVGWNYLPRGWNFQDWELPEIHRCIAITITMMYVCNNIPYFHFHNGNCLEKNFLKLQISIRS